MYVSYLQERGRPMTVVIDTPQPLATATAVYAAVQPRVPTRPVLVRTLATQVDNSLIRERLLAVLATVFGTLALTLAAVGLYGLISYAVTSRTREIGVHLALGARPSTIRRHVLARALQLVTYGVVIGWPAAWWLSRFAAALTFGVSPADPATFNGATGVLLIGGLLAAAGPARRAARVDPALSLRTDHG